MHRFRPRTITALATAALAAAAGIAAQAIPAAAASSGTVINEVYGGGGNSGATLTNDFIELANAAGGNDNITCILVRYFKD